VTPEVSETMLEADIEAFRHATMQRDIKAFDALMSKASQKVLDRTDGRLMLGGLKMDSHSCHWFARLAQEYS
jgi:hypothetical protein